MYLYWKGKESQPPQIIRLLSSLLHKTRTSFFLSCVDTGDQMHPRQPKTSSAHACLGVATTPQTYGAACMMRRERDSLGCSVSSRAQCPCRFWQASCRDPCRRVSSDRGRGVTKYSASVVFEYTALLTNSETDAVIKPFAVLLHFPRHGEGTQVA